MEERISRLREIIEGSDDIVFFGGAGVSTESGIPDFRSADGLYNSRDVRFDGYSPEYLLSHTCLVREPKVFYEFYRQKLDTRLIRPNAAHLYLARLEERGKLRAVVTQNIDSLHQRAGSKRVYEIHGTTARNYCMKCGKQYDGDYIFRAKTDVPRCDCGGLIRPDVTLYEESLPVDAVDRAVEAIRQAQVLIIGGTSLRVYPAASFIHYFRGEHLVVINREHLDVPLREGRDLEINGSIGQVFSALED